MEPRDEDPTELIRAQVATTPVASVRVELTVIAGLDAGKRFAIEDLAHRRVLAGQSPACEIRLTDPSVSRRHVALEIDPDGLRLCDLGSTNGTFVGRSRIRDVYLASADRISIGGTTLEVVIDPQERPVEASEATRFGRVIGASPEMRRLYPLFERLAASDLPILIEGESGTGKEVLAESLHAESARRSGPFVVFDCTTVAPTLLEAELFGHERGAFTGAVQSRPGLFEEAHGGTLFIDEIGDLALPLQAKLLRVLDRREVRRVGGNGWLKVDARIIAATRRDLDAEVQARRFRDDLFFRLAVGRVELPPLRKRSGDVALLTRCFWTLLGGEARALSPEVVQRFEESAWPGNVRELYNAVARQLALGDAGLPAPSSMPAASGVDTLDRIVAERWPLARAKEVVIEELERRYVKEMLAAHGGHVGRAAEAAGVGRRYFQKLRSGK